MLCFYNKSLGQSGSSKNEIKVLEVSATPEKITAKLANKFAIEALLSLFKYI